MSYRNACCACAATAALIAGAPPAFADAPVGTDEIIVTASPLNRSVEDTILGTAVIADDKLQQQLENSIGETLRRQPGVSSTFFGPGASRPVIRGLGGDRISVLDSGIGSIDASSTSPDHAVAVEPATAERIEIVRGPATLLYGSSAAGGVINVFNGRIPRSLPEGGVDGGLRIGKSTVDDGAEASGGFDLKLLGDETSGLVFHGEGFYRKADDYKIPGFAESALLRAMEDEHDHHDDDHDDDHDDHDHDDEEEVFGIAENSSFETKGGAAGLSWVFGNGFFGFSGTAINTSYGVPGGHHHHHDDDHDHDHDDDDHDHDDHDDHDEFAGVEADGVRIELKQRRFDFDSEIESDFLMFRKAKLRLGYADYEHAEIEPNGEVGTVFSNEGVEGRLELVDKTHDLWGGALNGALGFQFKSRHFSAIGEEAFTPPTDSLQYGLFGLKEYETGPWRFEVGARYEHTSHEVEDTGFERKFDAVSVSGGIGLKPAEGVFLGVSGFRTERAPSTEELFSNGPHLATNAFEIGDPTLSEEVGRGVEATMRVRAGRVSFAINGFYTSYKDFIYEDATGEEEDELPVFRYFADNATFKGFEAQVEAEIFQAGAFDVHADVAVDYVRAKTESGDLPRIPPFSGVFGLEAKSAFADLRGEIEYAGKQESIAAFELPTESYTLYNAYLTLRPFHETSGLAVRVAATNLSNEDARLHTSFLKDVAPLPGRNVKIALTGKF